MISLKLRIVIGIVVIVYFYIVMLLLIKKKLLLRYSLLWLLVGGVMFIVALEPEILTFFTELVGIELPVNGLFLVGISFSVILIMSITSIVSTQSQKINTLIQDNAILEKRIRELEHIIKGEKADG